MAETKRLGDEAFKHQRYEEAASLYSKALSEDPTLAAVLRSNASACYSSLGRWEEARREAAYSISSDSNFVKAYGRLGAALTELGRYDEALSTLQTGISKGPDNEPLKAQLQVTQAKKAVWTQLLGDQLLTKKGIVSTVEALKGKKRIAIYFSAHWCPPCRGFTPMLAELYQDVRRGGADDLEVVFCSSDHDNSAFAGYYAEMPWIAVPFDSAGTRDALSRQFDVRGIPHLVVLDRSGRVLDADARSTVASAGGSADSCLRRWSR